VRRRDERRERLVGLAAGGGLTAQDAAERLGARLATLRKDIQALARAGRIEAAGRDGVGNGAGRGRGRTIYRAADPAPAG